MSDEKMDLILRQVQLIARDRLWNNPVFESQAKITDVNISELLNPKAQPSHASKTKDALSEGKEQ